MDHFVLWAMVALTLAVAGVFVKSAPRRSLKVKFGLFAVMYFLYSGVGIAFVEDANRYLIRYALFLAAVFVGIRFAAGNRTVSVDATPSPTHNPAKLPWWERSVSASLAALYLIAAFGQVVAAGAAWDIVRPDRVLLEISTGQDIFTSRMERSSNTAFVTLAYIKLLCTPFFFIELQNRLGSRWLGQLVVLVGIAYLEVAADDHWGRTALLEPFGLWLLILYLRGRISGSLLAGVSAVGFLLALPFLNWLVAWRTGGASGTAAQGLLESLRTYRTQELSYPNLYPLAEMIGEGGGYAIQYLSWVATLPVPRAWTGTSFSVTRDFSEQILGIPYGGSGFYILLPSWLGESFIAFGPDFFWVWGLIVGILVGIVDRFLSLNAQLSTLNAYVTVLLAIYARSVSQEFLAQMINILWLLVLFYILRELRGRLSTPPAKRAAARQVEGMS